MPYVLFVENPVNSTFKTYLKPDHFSPPSLLSSWTQAM